MDMQYKKKAKAKFSRLCLMSSKAKEVSGLWNKRVKTKEYWVKAEIQRSLTKI